MINSFVRVLVRKCASSNVIPSLARYKNDGSELKFFAWFPENSTKSTYKIEESGNLQKL